MKTEHTGASCTAWKTPTTGPSRGVLLEATVTVTIPDTSSVEALFSDTGTSVHSIDALRMPGRAPGRGNGRGDADDFC